jgi:acetyl-CoA acetyltransferase family protein
MTEAFIPYGQYWTTPFARWQGALSHLHSLKFAAHVAKAELARRGGAQDMLTSAVLGTTVPQKHAFYGAPWVMGMIGAPDVTGPTLAQACATSAACVQQAQFLVGRDATEVVLVLAADRTSNGPHLYYPAPTGPGGTGDHEDWILGNFRLDPFARVQMVETAENVAHRFGISRAEQDEVTLMRYAQYASADASFRGRTMVALDVPDTDFRKTVGRLEADEGIFPTTAEGLAKLKPVIEGGSVTYGTQTHPADGNAGMIVTSRQRARDLSARPEISIRIRACGTARVEPAHMPMAPIPAARQALQRAGLEIGQIKAMTSHNPFVVNDIAFARETGFDLARMNQRGCSLVWGHPQGPTGLRAMIELIETLVDQGGGLGMFQGCAAGDTAMAVILEVTES